MRKILFILLLAISLYPAVIDVQLVTKDSIAGIMLDEGTGHINEKYYLFKKKKYDPVTLKEIKDRKVVLKGQTWNLKAGDILLDQDWYILLRLLESNGDVESSLAGFPVSERTAVFREIEKMNHEEFKEHIRGVLTRRLRAVDNSVKSGIFTAAESSLYFIHYTLGEYYFTCESDFRAALDHYLKGLKLRPQLGFREAMIMINMGDCFLNLGNKKEARAYYEKGLSKLEQKPQVYSLSIKKARTRLAALDKKTAPVPKPEGRKPPTVKASSLQSGLVKTARGLLGRRWPHGTSVKGKKFRYDCSGTVSRIYWMHGIDLYKDAAKYRGKNGVSIIYLTCKAKGLLHNRKIPLPGDLVFFDNTYDRNRDGRWNDRLVHIGIVEKVDRDGTISFIHHCSSGIKRYKMNLYKPKVYKDRSSGKVYNSYIRRRSKRDPKGSVYVSGNFFAGFATIAR